MHMTVQQMTQEIVEILSQLTERNIFDKESELFDQGVNSLQMTILVDELNQRFNLGAGLEILAEGASIDAIAESLNKKLLTRMNG